MSLKRIKFRAGTLSAAFLSVVLTLGPASAQEGSGAPVLAPDAPKSYTVRQGDTLWDISSLFLRDPWLWPEIWYVNPQVENPHLIYPGDVLTLAYGADGRPQLVLERGGADRLSPRIRSTPLAGAITAIPYDAVAAFMSRPMVLEKDQIRSAPHVVASREQHLAMAAGNTVYARNLDGQPGTRYAIVHVGEALKDPDDGDVVGRHGIFTGEAKLTRAGEPATLQITSSERETYNGDLLFPSDVDVKLDFIPHAPEQPVDGRIMHLINAVSQVGQYQAVVINRGSRHGLEPGHVLEVLQAGQVVTDSGPGESRRRSRAFGSKVELPEERAGTLMVFKAFDRISYGLILESEIPIRELDRVSNP